MSLFFLSALNQLYQHTLSKMPITQVFLLSLIGNTAISELYHTGMRISEVLGLTWNNIDFEKNIITLDKQIVYISRKGYYFSTLKTESSNRFIVIDKSLAGELLSWRNEQLENEKNASASYVSASYVYVYRNSDNKITGRLFLKRHWKNF